MMSGNIQKAQSLRQYLRKYGVDKLVVSILGLCACISIVTTFGIIFVLSKESFNFFQQVSIFDFLFGTRWEPLLEPQHFGVLPLVCGTMMIVVGSGLISIPLGLVSAIYLSEYASKKTRDILKPILEILAGIPTVVYGYFALTAITPILKYFMPETQVFNALAGAIVVGVMTLPMVSSLCDDAFHSIPKGLKQGGFALGGTSFEIIKSITLPAALPRVIAAFILALSRAIGETMAVTLAAGATAKLTWNPLESIQTMTAYIVQVSLGDIPAGGIEYQTSFAVGSLLFVMTLLMNIIGRRIYKRYQLVIE